MGCHCNDTRLRKRGLSLRDCYSSIHFVVVLNLRSGFTQFSALGSYGVCPGSNTIRETQQSLPMFLACDCFTRLPEDERSSKCQNCSNPTTRHWLNSSLFFAKHTESRVEEIERSSPRKTIFQIAKTRVSNGTHCSLSIGSRRLTLAFGVV